MVGVPEPVTVPLMVGLLMVPPDTDKPLTAELLRLPPVMVAPFSVPVQAKLPLLLVTVQPVLPEPPPRRISPVEVAPMEMVPVVPASMVRPVAAACTAMAVLDTFSPLTAVAVSVPPETLPPLKVPPDSVPPLMVAPLMVEATANVPVKLALDEIVWPLIRPEVMVPMLTRLPLASMRWVPAPAPVLMPVVPLMVVPVMVLLVAMVPKPAAMEPADRAPVPVMAEKVPAVRLLLVMWPLTMALPLYWRTSPLAKELRVNVVPCSLAMVGLG